MNFEYDIIGAPFTLETTNFDNSPFMTVKKTYQIYMHALSVIIYTAFIISKFGHLLFQAQKKFGHFLFTRDIYISTDFLIQLIFY